MHAGRFRHFAAAVPLLVAAAPGAAPGSTSGSTSGSILAVAEPQQQQTILFIRHAEKLRGGLGQLSCKGLNRALKLGARLQQRYGGIDAVFAPDPSWQKHDGALAYDYVRPLATVEPTAIRFGLPVHASIGFGETERLAAALLAPEFRSKTVLVAWEHHALAAMVPALLRSLGGDRAAAPDWDGGDFDAIWRVTITRDGTAAPAVAFHAERQDLDGLPDTCPD